LHWVPLISKTINALALQQKKPMLVVVNFLHIKKFSWLEIHDLEYHTQWKHRQSIRMMNTFFA
jgi:hypothetical protein